MKRRSTFLALLSLGALALARVARSEDSAPPADVEKLVQTLERLGNDPKALNATIEALKKKAEEARKALSASKPASDQTNSNLDSKSKRAEALKAEIQKTAAQLDASKAELTKLEKEIADLKSQTDADKQKQSATSAELSALERALEILNLVAKPDADPKPKSDAKADAPAKAQPLAQSVQSEVPSPKAQTANPKPENPTADKIAPEAAEFFENKIRPVLAQNCFSCHGPMKQKSGLRLDSREAMLKGGDRGAAVAPGDPDKSLVIQAIRYDGEPKMPPDKKLPQEAIDALTQWVKMGAPWPTVKSSDASANAAVPNPIADARQKHWAFKPIQNSAVPRVKNTTWASTPIDNFILAKLEEKGIAPSPKADRRTLIRRATFDLIGLPPTPEEIAAFEADASPDAFAKVVDRLLASPRYGERWGRYWLDVARYADTKGYTFEEERRYPFSYTYRDYVIRAFNEDVPYDRFITEQIAADQLDLKEDKRPLAAMGFLTLGRRFLNNPHDIIDDRIDVITRGTMGLTVQCARCHDHKFDPIPTADYYSLYGVFSNSVEPADLPLIETPKETDPSYIEFKRELEKRQKEAADYLEGKHAEFLSELRAKAGDYLLATHEAVKTKDEEAFQKLARDRNLQHQILRKWQKLIEETGKKHSPVFAAWNALSALPDDEFTTRSTSVISSIKLNADADHPHNGLVAKSIGEKPPASLKETARRYGELFADADKRWGETLQIYSEISAQPGQEKNEAPKTLPDVAQEEIRQVLYGPAAPGNIAEGETEQLMDLQMRDRIKTLRRSVDTLKATHPGRPARAHVLQDAPKPQDAFILTRGNPGNRGAKVPRQFPEILAGENRKPFEKGSGRLELAQAISSKDNPLTARVIVNRVWLNHFGAGLVKTPSDFGLRSEPPSHPEMLDYLATRFMEEGWSLKKLHRLIMLSSVYQQSSDDNPGTRASDAENRLLWRFNRRRLDFEALRDSVLAVTGKLDLTMGGDAVNIAEPPYSNRRTVYGFVERQNLPGVFRMFDFASPDATSPQRHETTVPQQALFMMNSPFVVNLAKNWTDRGEIKNEKKATTRIEEFYRLAYGRDPSPKEIGLGLDFLVSQAFHKTDGLAQNWQYGWGEFDETKQTVKGFEPLPHWSGTGWRGGEKLPDPKLGWVYLNRRGGHPGHDAQHCAIRRWIAPRDGVVSISGTIEQMNEAGDGIAAWIVADASGSLGNWTVHNTRVESPVARVEVHRGETIDFIVAPRANEVSDEFNWAPKIQMVEERLAANRLADAENHWDSAEDFAGPPEKQLSAWEQYAQTLLMTNEFAFVD